MRTFIILIIAAFLLVPLSAYAGGWTKHSYDDLAFSVSCPPGWDIRKLSAGAEGDIVAIILPQSTARSGFRANLVITSSIQDDRSIPLNELYKMNIGSMSSSPEFRGFKQQNSYKIDMDGLEAYQTTFTYTHPKLGVKLKSFQIYVMSGDRLYILQYAAPTLTYKKFMDDVNEIVRTFKPAK